MILDIIRKKYIVLTPEEWVRQHFVNYLILDLHYPKSLFKIESGLKFNHMQKRSDILIHDRTGAPWMLVECKSPDIKLTQKAFNQIAVYNMTIGAKYLAVTNGMAHYCCVAGVPGQPAVFLDDFPVFAAEQQFFKTIHFPNLAKKFELMNIKELDHDIQEIIKKRNELQKIDYSNPKYDDLEEELHDHEDDFQDKYGDFLEGVLQDIHDEHCPDSDVLMPIAYLAKKYSISDKGVYSVEPSEGVFVETEKFAGKDTKLVIVPNPLRIVLNVSGNQQVVWEGK